MIRRDEVRARRHLAKIYKTIVVGLKPFVVDLERESFDRPPFAAHFDAKTWPNLDRLPDHRAGVAPPSPHEYRYDKSKPAHSTPYNPSGFFGTSSIIACLRCACRERIRRR